MVLTGDTCADPRQLTFNASGVATFAGDNSNYASDDQGSCGDSRDAVFRFTLTSAATVDISATGASAWHVRTNCQSSATELGCSSTNQPLALAAGTYFVWVEAQSAYSLSVRRLNGDDCSTAEPILNGTDTTQLNAALDMSFTPTVPSNSCGVSGPDRAYRFSISSERSFQAQLTNTSGVMLTLILQRVSGLDCTAATEVTCGTTVTANSLPPGDYLLWVKGASYGSYRLNASLMSPNQPCNVNTQNCVSASDGCYVGMSGTVCVPAGTKPVGAACVAPNECMRGAQCFSAPNGSPICHEFCNVNGGAPLCPSGKTCGVLGGTTPPNSFGACF